VAPVTLGEAVSAAAALLDAAGVADARRDARLLLGHALGVGREVVLGHPERPLDAGGEARLGTLVARRAAREPMAYITGEREFWSLPFRVGRAALIPRPDSETVVEAALAWVPDRAATLRLLDLGTGSGCLLLALLSELGSATGVGLDRSAKALEMARKNARRLGLDGRCRFLAGDWGAPLTGPFDLIVANPPYVAEDELAALEPEVAFEPRLALAAGQDGLAAYRALAPHMARLLAPAGAAVVEVGAGQARAVASLMSAAGLGETGRRRDLAGIERCLVLGKPGGGRGSTRNLGINERIYLENRSGLIK
jgi:release factor glutamine methyltransferase